MTSFPELTSNLVGHTLKAWRQTGGMSQLDLAMEIDVSARHLSFVENGKSQPSRELIIRFAKVLKVPERQLNSVLMAAGLPTLKAQKSLNQIQTPEVQEALSRILTLHSPYPALVMNTQYDILMSNEGFQQSVAHFAANSDAVEKYDNMIRLMFAEDGLKHAIHNWSVVAYFLYKRLRDEATATKHTGLQQLAEELAPCSAGIDPNQIQLPDVPAMTITLEKDGKVATFFSTITTFGSPLDASLQELKIESMFPADEETKRLVYDR